MCLTQLFINNVQNVFRSKGEQADPILLASSYCHHCRHSLNMKCFLYLSAWYLVQNLSQSPAKLLHCFFLSPYDNVFYTFSL